MDTRDLVRISTLTYMAMSERRHLLHSMTFMRALKPPVIRKAVGKMEATSRWVLDFSICVRMREDHRCTRRTSIPNKFCCRYQIDNLYTMFSRPCTIDIVKMRSNIKSLSVLLQ